MPDKDVLGKADALLRRHTLPLPGSGSDTGGVPVLTELVEAPPAAAAPDMGRAVVDRVMKEVEAHLAAELERRISNQLAGQVQAAVAAALAELRPELARTIAEAVKQELEGSKVK